MRQGLLGPAETFLPSPQSNFYDNFCPFQTGFKSGGSQGITLMPIGSVRPWRSDKIACMICETVLSFALWKKRFD